MFLKSQNITVRREGSPPLSFPDLSINTGDKVLLLGPSGSGKTTFLSVLAGLLRPSAGEVFIEDGDFYAMSSSARDKVRGQNFGFIFQTLHLLPSLTLAQNIMLAADMAGAKPEAGRLDHLLKTLGLTDKAHRKPDALSQGEQQRAAIARAVLLRPKIIMADEPTSALDDDNAKAVMNLLESQAKETGAALLIATHDGRIKENFKTIINLENQMPKNNKEAA
ncbi:MAG: ABC transporter ATP-binding protein [Rhodospirillales bacterium]|nr:ABC transporter ATP-binding protein [Rhodospirillales bacterium]